MEKENIGANGLEDLGNSRKEFKSQPKVDEAVSSNIQIHGGCGLGAVVLLNDKPPKSDESETKIKDEVKRNTMLPPSRASSSGKGVGISIKSGRSTKTDRRKNSIGHTILIPTTRRLSKDARSYEAQESFILGIDLGTTSVKVCLVNTETQVVSDLKVKETLAFCPSDCGSVGDQQVPSKIYSALHSCIAKICRDRLTKVVRIAFCGQMHGVMFWKRDKAWKVHTSCSGRHDPHDRGCDNYEVKETSSLYTWQDGRCDQEFMNKLPMPMSHLRLATGYGCATIFWFVKNYPEFFTHFDCCGTIMDFVVAMITDNHDEKPVMSAHNAASWGYFDTVSNKWNEDLLRQEGFPVDLLPPVVAAGTDVGVLPMPWFDIPKGTPVSVALGDHQCAVMGTIIDTTTDVVLNISTSAQMFFVMPKGFVPPLPPFFEAPNRVVEYLPYLDNRYIAAAASLTGGNSLAAFVKMVQLWADALEFRIPRSKIWERILHLGQMEQKSRRMSGGSTVSSLPSGAQSPIQGQTKSTITDTRRDAGSQKTSLEESRNLVHLYPPQINGSHNESTSATNSTNTDHWNTDHGLMKIVPRLFGERHDPEIRATARNIRRSNISLGKVTLSICQGIVSNMAEMMPPTLIHRAGMTRIIGSGGGLCRNPILEALVRQMNSKMVQEKYKLPVEFNHEGNSCVGAALAVIANPVFHLNLKPTTEGPQQ